MDVARILIRDPEELARTDVSQPVLDALMASNVREVHVIGRRGPAQAKFTTKELRELGELPGVEVVVHGDEADLNAFDLAGELGWDRFSVIGHSMGAKVAHQMLLQAPDRLDKLVGLNPVPPGAVPMDEQGWELFSGAAANAGNRAAIIDFTTGSRLTATFINHVVRHSLENSNQAAFAAYLQAWAKTDFSGKVQPDTRTPVKVIVGVNDPALSADVMEQTWLAFYPNAELDVLANAGHYPMFETPAALVASIEEFLGQG